MRDRGHRGHPSPRGKLCRSRNPSIDPTPRMNGLHRNDSYLGMTATPLELDIRACFDR
jgi:hypothetical protein